jgi:hypothetical protein
VEVFSREDLPYSICQQCSEPNSPEASSVGCHVVPAPGGLGVVDLLPPSPLLPSQERVCIGYEPILTSWAFISCQIEFPAASIY